MVVELDEPLAAPVDLSGVQLASSEADGRRLTFTLDGASAGAPVARLATTAALRDLSVVEPAIDDVVARLYASGRAAERVTGVP